MSVRVIKRPLVTKNRWLGGESWHVVYPTVARRIESAWFHRWRDAYDFAYVVAHVYPPAEVAS